MLQGLWSPYGGKMPERKFCTERLSNCLVSSYLSACRSLPVICSVRPLHQHVTGYSKREKHGGRNFFGFTFVRIICVTFHMV